MGHGLAFLDKQTRGVLDGLYENSGMRVPGFFSTNYPTYRLILHQANDELSVLVPGTIEIDLRRLRRGPSDLKWRSHVFVNSRDDYHAASLEWLISFCSLGSSHFLSRERWASASDCRPRLPYVQVDKWVLIAAQGVRGEKEVEVPGRVWDTARGIRGKRQEPPLGQYSQPSGVGNAGNGGRAGANMAPECIGLRPPCGASPATHDGVVFDNLQGGRLGPFASRLAGRVRL